MSFSPVLPKKFFLEVGPDYTLYKEWPGDTAFWEDTKANAEKIIAPMQAKFAASGLGPDRVKVAWDDQDKSVSVRIERPTRRLAMLNVASLIIEMHPDPRELISVIYGLLVGCAFTENPLGAMRDLGMEPPKDEDLATMPREPENKEVLR